MAATGAVAQMPAEWLAQAPLPELVVGHELERDGSLIVELIPPGESVERWSRMVTTQRFGGAVAGGLTLRGFVANFLGGLQTGCPGYRASAPVYTNAGSQPEVAFQVDCPRNPVTGQPETFLLRAFAGSSDLHVLQVAFRHVPTPAEVAWARAHLASAILCDRSSRAPACQSRAAAPGVKSGEGSKPLPG